MPATSAGLSRRVPFVDVHKARGTQAIIFQLVVDAIFDYDPILNTVRDVGIPIGSGSIAIKSFETTLIGCCTDLVRPSHVIELRVVARRQMQRRKHES